MIDCCGLGLDLAVVFFASFNNDAPSIRLQVNTSRSSPIVAIAS
jgi:hypothetical protein